MHGAELLELCAVERHEEHLRRAEEDRQLRQACAAVRTARAAAGTRLGPAAGAYLLRVARVVRLVRAAAPRRVAARPVAGGAGAPVAAPAA